MPKANQLPDNDRRITRPGNANAHPGKIVLEALAIRRNKEVIDEENKGREERRQTRKEKKKGCSYRNSRLRGQDGS